MLQRIIEYSVKNRFLVILVTVLLIVGGTVALVEIPLDAIPDLSDVQVIIMTEYAGQAPQVVEDQVTYPLTTAMLAVPYAKTVRGYSFFGLSFVYIIFEDGTDLYWARSRVLEYLSYVSDRLPPGVNPGLGPDATGVGWVYEYVLRSDRHDLAELRSIQDWFLRYELTSVPGVSEVASIGGFVKQYQVEVDPNKLLIYNIPLNRIKTAIQRSNNDVGGRVIEMAESEYMVRGLGYIQSVEDLENVTLGVDDYGTPVMLHQVARVTMGPELRRGLAEWNGEGEIVGGIIVMRYGENALEVIRNVEEKLESLKSGLPEGVEVITAYNRANLIERAIDNLRNKLFEESLIVALVCIIFLIHFRSALVVILTLPISVLAAFLVMSWQGINANIMSLGGIAIAIGTLVDAAIVMIENTHKHMERDRGKKDHWQIVLDSTREVGPSLFYSLLIITLSFAPIFALEAQEGRLFKPLAYTKTYTMAAAALLAITFVPVLTGYLVRGRILPERRNPLSRLLVFLYRPVIRSAIRLRWLTIGVAVIVLSATWYPLQRIGSEFMPPLYEGDLLYMPTTDPGISITKARQLLQQTDKIIRSFPEVEQVFGKVGRADTATDPAPLSMIETTIMLKPEDEWRPGMTREGLVEALNDAIQFPGLTNAWTMPIRTRIDMLSTGIRTPVGVKLMGDDLAVLSDLAQEIAVELQDLPGTLSVYPEKTLGGNYLDFDIDRIEAARYGMTVGDVQDIIMSAVGGVNVTYTVEGLERYPVNVRYARELRDDVSDLRRVMIPTPSGAQIPISQVAEIRIHKGPSGIKSENAQADGLAVRGSEGYGHRRLRGLRPAAYRGTGFDARGVQHGLERTVRVHGTGAAAAADRHTGHPGHHSSSALHEFQERRRQHDRDAVAALRAGGRCVADVPAGLRLQHRGGGRVHRAGRRGGGNGGRHAALSRSGPPGSSAQEYAEHPEGSPRGGHARGRGAGPSQDDDGGGHHGRVDAHHVGDRHGFGGHAAHRRAHGGRHGDIHGPDARGHSGHLLHGQIVGIEEGVRSARRAPRVWTRHTTSGLRSAGIVRAHTRERTYSRNSRWRR